MSAVKLLFFDCDSTLSAIEGVDELAGLRGPDAFAAVKDLTDRAMDGEVPIGEVFARRLDIIRPSRADCDAVGRIYIERIEPTAVETIAAVRAAGWRVIILSGGFTEVIRPLAILLEIGDIEAVGLRFDESGAYRDFDRAAPTTRNGGKPEVIAGWKQRFPGALTVMVGDGVSDLEAATVVDRFIGYGGFASRPPVREKAEHFITRLRDLPPLLDF